MQTKQDFSSQKLKPDLTASSSLLKAEDYCLRAERLLQKQQWKAAQKILQKGLLEVEKTAKAYHLLGLVFYHQGFFQLALNHFQKASGMENKAEYFLNLSIALNELGQYGKAKRAYEKAQHIQYQTQEQNWKEEVAQRHNQTAKAYLKKNQLQSALEEYVKSFKFYKNSEVQIQIARLLWKLNQKEIAQKYLINLISLYPNNVSARLLLAGWYFENKKLPKAINEWETVLMINPQNKEAYHCLLKVQNILD